MSNTVYANRPVIGPVGKLALEYCGVRLPLQVLQSQAGYYIGTFDPEGCGPVSRESCEYWRKESDAQLALSQRTWTQKESP